jgi:hypothetical protein
MDQRPSRTPGEMKLLEDEAKRRALEISELEEDDDFDFKLVFSILLPMPGMSEAARTRGRKLTCVEHFRRWLKENNLTPRECGIGLEFVKKYIPEYSFLY